MNEMNGMLFCECLLGVMLLVIIALVVYILQLRRKERKIQDLVETLESDHPVLFQRLQNLEHDESIQLIEKRMTMLRHFLAAGVSDDPARMDAVLKELDELVAKRREFMREIRLIYGRMQPNMIRYFQKCGLTEEEIELCSLYALGLNGKEIQQYTRNSRHYQDVGLIRKKLDLGEHDKNIDRIIQALLR